MKKYVPEYEIVEFREKRFKYALVIFAINEGQLLETEIKRLKKSDFCVDIILADGGSDDGSTKLNFLKKNAVKTLLIKKSKGGLSTQMLMAFDYCLKLGYEGVICVDGNNKDDPGSVPQFINILNNGFDHVQGSRFIAGGYHQNTPISRWLAIKLIHAPLIRLAAKFPYTDTTNGFRAYSRKLLSDSRIDIFRTIFSKYELHYHLAVEAARLGFRVAEVPVGRIYPKGKVPSKIKSLTALLEIIKVLIRINLGYYRNRIAS